MSGEGEGRRKKRVLSVKGRACGWEETAGSSGPSDQRAHMSSALNSKHACYELDHLEQIHCNMKGMCKPTL